MSIFKGAGVAIVTPMKENGEVNYEKFAEMIEFQIANGTDAIIVCGTTGESSTLTHEEHLDVIKYCTEKVAGRIPVVAGTGSNCTETAVYLSKEAEKYGVDGLLLVSPYYNKATQNGLYTHFKTIAESVKLPIILYNVPSRTGCNILPDTVIRLCHDVENIVGVKEASGNLSQIARLAAKAKGTVDFEGDVEGSRDLQLRAMDLCDALFCEVNPIPVKKALNLMGMEAGSLRLPLTEMEEANAAKLEKAMREFGILK